MRSRASRQKWERRYKREPPPGRNPRQPQCTSVRFLSCVVPPGQDPLSAAMLWRKLGASNFSSCPNGSILWIWDVFHECVQDGWDKASVSLGLISILCFAASTFPQYIKACKTGNMDQALSVWFLLGWIGGDSCNLIGSFLADQLPLQSYTAVYYVLADLVMLTLYFHYKFKKRPSLLSAPINSVLLFISGTVCITPLLSSTGPVAAPREAFQGRMLLSVEPGNKPFTKQEIIGFVVGSVSSVLYLLSRLPQIRTNFLRKSTQGISYSLFALVMLGNALYGLSVLLKNPEVGQSEGSYMLHHLPWLVGSLGVLLLDTIISIQFLVYRDVIEAASLEREPLLSSCAGPE
ncbi:lysosomal amino acid transporter 1 homolog isoform X4 [Heterocephalus glaber]|uniref:Lysosomal amino acid transporter 1 homolog n=1 Tax=Heterocephalus glaber TaxID=10181 RepID=A0A0P6J0W4_HETGA|nr:lysosomal amino acid transporter 1 homolog isoform X4 [Heterocephalus glaber]XP_021118602.1 lysosomal amino acid transporter 1 homolog isoform X4 [Heterocephalus glaber]